MENDRSLFGRWVLADFPQNLQSVHVGHHQVEDDPVRRFHPDHVDRLTSATSFEDAITSPGEQAPN